MGLASRRSVSVDANEKQATKDIRTQFSDQIKCLEQRTETQLALLAEIQDFYRKRAEIELEYSKSLEKLTKQVLARHKTEKQKRDSWPLHSAYSLWQELVESSRSDAKQRATLADVYVNHVTAKLTNHGDDIQRISRKCREISYVAQQEICRVLNELHTALKTYQLCQHESCAVENKFRAAEQQKMKFEESYPQKVGNSRKHRFLEKEYEKRHVKYQEFKLRALKARNEYLLCINAANEALHKYYADDLSDMIDCMDLGMQQWVSALLSTVIEARHQLVVGETESISKVRDFADRLDSRADKQKFLEANHAMFMLPRKFEFRAHQSDEMRQVSAQKAVQEELIQRYMQMNLRMSDLKLETEEVWKTLETAEKRVLELQKQPVLNVPELFSLPSSLASSQGMGSSATSSGQSVSQSTTSSSSGGGVPPTLPDKASEKPKTCKEPEMQIQKRRQDLAETEDFYMEKFQQYITNGNLIRRLTARYDTLGKALGMQSRGGSSGPQGSSMTSSGLSLQTQNGHAGHYEHHRRPNGLKLTRQDSASAGESDGVTTPGSDGAESRLNAPPSVPPKPRKKRIGVAGRSPNEKRPKLFGGSLEEYVEATGEEIPLVIRSCVGILSVFALHHQGLFRVSGSQLEINKCRDAFEKGEDPWTDLDDSNPDVNSVAGVLKLYFRELREPLFPIYMFDQFTDCAQAGSKEEFGEKIRELIKTLPRPIFVVLRYLFGFLNHLSEFSDENMMDPYNLAVCFGPTLLPIPEGKDQVFFHNHVNEVMKNLIMMHDEVFPPDGGMVYEKYHIAEESTEDNLDEPDREREDSHDPESGRNRSESVDIVSDEEDEQLRLISRADWLKSKTNELEHLNFRPIDDNSTPSSDTEPLSRENQAHSPKTRSSENPEGPSPQLSPPANERQERDGPVPEAPPLLLSTTKEKEGDVWLKRASMQRAIRERPIELSPKMKDGGFRFEERMPAEGRRDLGINRREARRHSERASSGKSLTKSSCAALTSESMDSTSHPHPPGIHPPPPNGALISSYSSSSKVGNPSQPPSSFHPPSMSRQQSSPTGKDAGGGRMYSSAVDWNYYHEKAPVAAVGLPVGAGGSVKGGDLGVAVLPRQHQASGGLHYDKAAKRLSLQTDVPAELGLDEVQRKAQQLSPANRAPQLSPSSLSDIQTELKAVLNSLEHFTKSHQQQTEQQTVLPDPSKAAYEPDLVKNLPLTKSSPGGPQQSAKAPAAKAVTPSASQPLPSDTKGGITVKTYSSLDGKPQRQQVSPAQQADFGTLGLAAAVTGNIATAVGRGRARAKSPGRRPVVPRKPQPPDDPKMAALSGTSPVLGTREEKF